MKPAAHCLHWTQAEKDFLIENYATMPRRDLENRLCRTWHAIRKAGEVYTPYRRSKSGRVAPSASTDDKKIREFYGIWSLTALAKMLGRSPNTVKWRIEVMRQAGLLPFKSEMVRGLKFMPGELRSVFSAAPSGSNRCSAPWLDAELEFLANNNLKTFEAMAAVLRRSPDGVRERYRVLARAGKVAPRKRGGSPPAAYTQEENARIVELRTNGASWPQIARRINRSIKGVAKQGNALLGRTKNSHEWAPEEVAALKVGLQQGLSRRQLSEQLGRSVGMVVGKINRMDKTGELDGVQRTRRRERSTAYCMGRATASLPNLSLAHREA